MEELATKIAAVAASIRSVDDILRHSVAASTTGAVVELPRSLTTSLQAPRREQPRPPSRRVTSDVVQPSKKAHGSHGHSKGGKLVDLAPAPEVRRSTEASGYPRLTHERLQQYATAHAALTSGARGPRSMAGSAMPRRTVTAGTAMGALVPSPHPPQSLGGLAPAPGPYLVRAISAAPLSSPQPLGYAGGPGPGVSQLAPSAAGGGGARPVSPGRRPGSPGILHLRSSYPQPHYAASQQLPFNTQQQYAQQQLGAWPPPERAFGPRATEYPSRAISAPRPAADPHPGWLASGAAPIMPILRNSSPPPATSARPLAAFGAAPPAGSTSPRVSPRDAAGVGGGRNRAMQRAAAEPAPPWQQPPAAPPAGQGPLGQQGPGWQGAEQEGPGRPQPHAQDQASSQPQPAARYPTRAPSQALAQLQPAPPAGPAPSPALPATRRQQSPAGGRPRTPLAVPQQQLSIPPQPPPGPPRVPLPRTPPGAAQGQGQRRGTAAGAAAGPAWDSWGPSGFGAGPTKGARPGASSHGNGIQVVGLRDVPPSRLPHARAVVGRTGSRPLPSHGATRQGPPGLAGPNGGGRRTSDAGTHASWWLSAEGSAESYPLTAITDRHVVGPAGEEEQLTPSEAAAWAQKVAELEAEVEREREARRLYEEELQRLAAAAGAGAAGPAGLVLPQDWAKSSRAGGAGSSLVYGVVTGIGSAVKRW